MTRDTSVETYRQIDAEGLLSKQRFLVYHALFDFGPCTAGELAQSMDNAGLGQKETRHMVSRRLPELRDVCVIRECGERPCRVGSRNSIVWDVTSDLPLESDTRVSFSEGDKRAALTALSRLRSKMAMEDVRGLAKLYKWLSHQVS